jgi:hypothetical protein
LLTVENRFMIRLILSTPYCEMAAAHHNVVLANCGEQVHDTAHTFNSIL